ncbi:MAG: methylated-DNA--[protein]-cysteine S-methyltransferase [Mariprofundaceae bacterium]
MKKPVHLFSYDSPLGGIGLHVQNGICRRVFLQETDAPPCPSHLQLTLWLDAYFSLPGFRERPRLGRAANRFQSRMRKKLMGIPPGQTLSYGQLAKRVGSKPRAIGQALGANPLPILVPCHRVVAKNGIGGFTCGEEWKRRLLQWEGAILL